MTIPKSRLDALTDGVFAVAMTLLVIDLRLPESFHAADSAAELLACLMELGYQRFDLSAGSQPPAKIQRQGRLIELCPNKT